MAEKISKNFYIQEFVPPEIFAKYGESSRWFVSPFQISVAQLIRDITAKKTYVNTWHAGGSLKQRGTRFGTFGAAYSQHRLANAIDISVEGLNPSEIHDLIVRRADYFKKLGLTTIEDLRYTPTWIHLDARWTNKSQFLYVRPAPSLVLDLSDDYEKNDV